ncbi:hypothetical protein R1flu_021873 [Riccia fluitans]|uniref:Hpc2-related domain-containing protein n=1 Tax=Riccia fluitans TaxID=41844 RepID=A0ABD1ZQL4_9MARC
MAATAFQSGGVATSASQGALDPKPPQRFYVDLKEGEVNVVSWKKLSKGELKNSPPVVSEARANRLSSVIEKIERLYQGGGSEEEGDVSPDESQYDTEDDFIDDSELNEYFVVEKTKTKHTGFFINRGKLEKIEEVPAPAPAPVPRKRKEREMKVAADKVVEKFTQKSINSGLPLKGATVKSLVSHAADGTPSSSTAPQPNGKVLERAIQDLEKGVAESFPPRDDKEKNMTGIKIAEEPVSKNKRIPSDVKQKLAKVARLAARQGKIPDELIDRLMKILGHVMRLRTLKSNLMAMVKVGLESDARLLRVKRELTESVKSQVSHQTIDADFQSTPGISCYKWDQSTEDRICEVYDEHVESMEEHRGSQIKKLYSELAELWPEGWMDNHSIKKALLRAKERQKKQSELKMGEENRMRKDTNMSEEKTGITVVDGLATSLTQPYLPSHIRLIPSSKEKLTVKSSIKQTVCESSRREDEDNRRVGKEDVSGHVEERRRLNVEEMKRALNEIKRSNYSGAYRENGSRSQSCLYEDKQKIIPEDGLKVRRNK